MNLKSIEYFMVTAEEMNITRAAERLYISQQALSSHIKRLEDEYNVILFERKPVFRLTKEGKEMLQYGRQMLDAEAHMQAAFSDINVNCKASLTIGIPRLRSMVFFPAIWRFYHPNHPNISIELVDGNSEKLNDMLLSGKIDLFMGINVPINSQQTRIELAAERIWCCFSRELLRTSYPDTWEDILLTARRRGLDINDVIRMPFGTMRTDNSLRQAMEVYFAGHQRPNIIFEGNQQDVIYAMSKGGSLAGLLSPVLFYTYQEERTALGDSFYVLPVINEIPPSTFSLVYRNDYPLPRYAMDFVGVACMVLKRYANEIDK